jgi:hypothetical protein
VDDALDITPETGERRGGQAEIREREVAFHHLDAIAHRLEGGGDASARRISVPRADQRADRNAIGNEAAHDVSADEAGRPRDERRRGHRGTVTSFLTRDCAAAFPAAPRRRRASPMARIRHCRDRTDGRRAAMDAYNYDTFRRHMMNEDMHFRGGPKPGESAPDFDLPTVDGGRFRLSEHRGRPVLIEVGSIT